MRQHLIVLTQSAAAASALILALCAAASPDAVATGTRAVAGGHSAASDGTWGKAEEVPGSARLNTGGVAEVRSVSCASVGNCGAGGNIQSSAGGRAWVANEVNGTWGRAEEVRGTVGDAQIESMSCPSAGNCGAGGDYVNRSGHNQAFVVSENNGAWGSAREVARALNTRGNAQIYTVSCGSAGNCAAGGYYRDNSGHYQAFAVTENNGMWGSAMEVAAALNTGGNSAIESVSCPSAGNCAAAGQYLDRSRHSQAFVINEVHGSWGAAKEVPGSAALNTGGNASIGSVSCTSAGNCGAGGQYVDRSGHTQVFVVAEVRGRWRGAEEVPGTAALNKGGLAQIGVSCPSAGNCSAGGSYADVPGHPFHWQAFVVDEVHGRWGTAEEVPGTAALNKGGNAGVFGLSCASASHCSAGGYYNQAHSMQEVFVVNKT